MSNFIYGLIAGVVVATIVCLVWRKIKKPAEEVLPEKENTNFNPNVEIKKENVAKLENFVAEKQAGDKITNDEVQNLLKVSDATAERYLNELENQGKLKQIGKIGHQVNYQVL